MTGSGRRRRLRPRLLGYAIALALAIAAVVVYGWAGWWLGLGLVAVTRLAVWALPLVKLSYTDDSKGSRAGG